MTNKTEPTVFDLLKAGKTVQRLHTPQFQYRLVDGDLQAKNLSCENRCWVKSHSSLVFFVVNEFREVKEPLTEEDLVVALVRGEDVEYSGEPLQFKRLCIGNTDGDFSYSLAELRGKVYRK